MNEETPEEVFFKYASGCGDGLFELRLIDKDKLNQIQAYLNKKEIPDKNFLEETYANAIRRIKELAEKKGKDYWDVSVIREYFLKEHNKVIDNKEGNYARIGDIQRELCKVKIGIVNKIYYNKEKLLVYDVDYGNKVQAVVGKYLPNVKIGDKISVHWNFAIEKI